MGIPGLDLHQAFQPRDGRGDAGNFVGKLPVVGIIGLQERHRHLRFGYRTTVSSFEIPCRAQMP
jgi:hypothetical protein